MGTVRREINLSWLIALLGALVFQLQEVVGSCPPLLVPSFGQLLHNSTDVTGSQPGAYSVNATVEYRCAQGYQLILASGSNIPPQSGVTTCVSNGTWSLLDVVCQFVPLPTDLGTNSPDDLNLAVSARDALIITGAALGGVVIIELLFIICCCCCVLRLRSLVKRRLQQEELITEEPDGLVMPNPIIEIKESEDNSSNPLYLTPSEMKKFDNKAPRQSGKLTRL